MKVEIAGALVFAALGLLVGALLRPQPDDFRPQVPETPAGFTGPLDSGAVGGADPTGGWGGRGLTGALPDYVVGTDSLRPPPELAAPPPAWEEPAEPPEPVSGPTIEDPPAPPNPAPGPTPAPPAPVQGAASAGPPPATGPSPSPPERPKEGP